MLRLTNEEIRDYAEGVDPKAFPYFCAQTGELADSLAYVVSATFHDLFHHGFMHRWKRTRAWQKPQHSLYLS